MRHVVRQFQDVAASHMRGSVDAARDATDMEAELFLSQPGILEPRLERIEALQKGARCPDRDSLIKDSTVLQFLNRWACKWGSRTRAAGPRPDGRGTIQLPAPYREALAYRGEHRRGCSDPRRTGPGGDGRSPEGVYFAGGQTGADPTRPQGRVGVPKIHGRNRVRTRPSGTLVLPADVPGAFFTYGPKDVRAWSTPNDTPVVRVAGLIHSNIERGLIRAEVVSFDDMVACGSVPQCKERVCCAWMGRAIP